ncbi:PilC/PilY family type IV pilus protein [Variovorax sp. ZS18.2.2]|uniref:pilus assembly protein n=1 Tax=Variovorax sp. ZS18.2.2 TaxID=2971255 RepID=UPI00215163F0|nr:PilC/PilY family type IV pilus protein [Variovorax sp. ZS18.2.2]MCR6479087.1 PilC/PilY family type IV pilus protein [Variovorax sp. ZS18.2.2]
MARSTPSKRSPFRIFHTVGLLAAAAAMLFGQHLATAQDGGDTALAQTPLFVSESNPPLNMLVMGRDHKLYYEAYNDASDLNGDGVIDVGYKPNQIDYYGYFNNNACYDYADEKFTPAAAATGDKKKLCGGTRWSGDFLNYLTTSRMDAIRRVLYGGTRVIDTATSTVLQGAYIPRDAHAWGKAYDPVRDGTVYNISDYAPLAAPVSGTRHLFAVTTLGETGDGAIPRLRVLNDSQFQIWDWVSKEGTAGQDACLGGVPCASGTVFQMLPSTSFQKLSIMTWKKTRNNDATPGNATEMAAFFAANAVSKNLCGTGTLQVINTAGGGNNPFPSTSKGCGQDNYLTEIKGDVNVPEAGTYTFAVDGDDAVEATIAGTSWGWYGGHGADRSQDGLKNHSKSITLAKGWNTVVFRHVEGSGDDNWGLALQVAVQPVSTIVTRKIRVEACSSTNSALREASCKSYPNNNGTAIFKPTGLLHDFGENEKMYFGLLSGSYQKNIAGGILRRNVSKFSEEVNPQTGQFKTDVAGIVTNMDRLRLIGFNGSQYNDCGWIVDGPISTKADPSMCSMWGNPVGEMMFETLRYFAGASGAHSQYDYGTGAKDSADPLNLSKPAWVAPYTAKANGGGGYPYCARPVMTVLSDINPSYDTKMPGSRYQAIDADASALTGFNVANEVQAIGTAEGINGKNFFIGQSTLTNGNGAPSVKTVDDLSLVRGLSPQEPSKEGSYYSAGVSRFAANNAVFGSGTVKNALMTYSVAIASPLPEIRFPVGSGRFVTISPFAKSVAGYNINPTAFAPTNQIVDYYVDRIANTGAADQNASINGGRPYAEFRINYEDVEQGADHDMDAISRYTVALQANGTVTVDMLSEYAAGSIGQHMGYVISGTTQDGMYLEVRDKDTGSVYYALNTPQGQPPGFCADKPDNASCANLPLTASRTFTPSTTGSSGSFLKNPLWYAAKYGMPGRDPTKVAGDPDNYFLVTNATTLKAQMTKAFNDILQKNNSVTAVSLSLPGGTIAAGADVYRTLFEADGWAGDVIRDKLTATNTAGPGGTTTTSFNTVRQWSAAEKLAARVKTTRNILYAGAGATTPTLRPFTFTGISAQTADLAWLTALNLQPGTSPARADGKAEQRIAFLRGENDAFRARNKVSTGTGTNLSSNVLGDIVNSSPLRVGGALYRAAPADALEGTGSNYATYATTQAGRDEMIYVGANDGMFHAFRAADGVEQFAFIPTAVRNNLNTLTAPDYGKKDGTSHRYYVDGSPVASDVYFGAAWHKVVIGSLSAGGRGVFALDVTDPASPSLLWEFGSDQNANMGNSLPKPTIARLNDPATGKGKWVALVPGGYQGGNSTAGGGGASLFVLDISNGTVLRQFDLDGGMTAEELAASLPLGNGLSRVSAVDNTRDGKVDLAYAGDLAGNVWRFDMSSGNISAWTVQKLYTAKDANDKRQAITTAPYVVPHPTGTGDLVIFGTGRLLTASDKSSTQRQTAYGIWDRYSGRGATAPTPLPTVSKGRGDLQSQSFEELGAGTGNFSLTNNTVSWYKANATGTRDTDVEKWGWIVDLPRNGEKMVYDMTLYGRGLFLTSVRTSDDACAAGLNGTIYGIDPNGGGRTDYVVFDMNSDGVFNSADMIARGQVNGTPTGGGSQTVGGGQVLDPSGDPKKAVNHGLQFGRQSWRKQPPN